MIDWKNLKKSENTQFIYNVISTSIRSGIIFLTMPVFTRLLGAEQYGKYSIYISWLTICTCFMGLNVGSSLGTAVYQYKQDYKKFRTSVLVEGTLSCFILVVLAAIFSNSLSKILELPQGLIILMVVEAFAQFVINFAGNAWIYEKKAFYNLLSSLAVLFLTTTLSIVLLLSLQYTLPDLYYARILGTAVPQIVIALIIWIFLFKDQKYGYNKGYWYYGLHFGLPMIFHTLSHQVLVQSDRVMMQKFAIPDKEIGIYSFFYTFTAVLSTVLTALNNSWSPFLYDLLEQKEYKKLNQKVVHYVQLFTCVACGFLMLSREVVKLFSNNEYWDGMPLIPILVLVIYFTFLYQFPVNLEFYYKKPEIVAEGTTVAAIINIILNFILIPGYGMYGAIAATLISYIILFLVHILIVKDLEKNPYPIRSMPMVKGLLGIIFGCILYYILADRLFIRWVIGGLLGIYLILKILKRKSIF